MHSSNQFKWTALYCIWTHFSTSKAPPHLVIQWNMILHETGVKLTKVLVDYWNDQKLAQGLEFE